MLRSSRTRLVEPSGRGTAANVSAGAAWQDDVVRYNDNYGLELSQTTFLAASLGENFPAQGARYTQAVSADPASRLLAATCCHYLLLNVAE